MSKRKPGGMSWESFADRQIREAQERGAFDDLPGQGKPLAGMDRPLKEGWWLDALAAREDLPLDNPALLLRREVGEQLEGLADLVSEEAVRERLERLNARIAKLNATNTAAMPTDLGLIKVEAALKRWRERRAERRNAATD